MTLGLAFLAAAMAPSPAAALADLEILGPQLAEVRAFSRSRGERLWPGFGSAPFEFLLIGAEREMLLCGDRTPHGFTEAGRDGPTGCAVRTRPRGSLPDSLLAAMPMFGPPSTIVMGTPATTRRSPATWLRTILHEHFHQWQSALPGYYARVDALDLKDGDKTGMWMLAFPFPYTDAQANARFNDASRTLADALAARGKRGFRAALHRYLRARDAVAAGVGERNWRYLEFQLWQEGIARWTEIELGRAYPRADVREAAAALEARTLADLRVSDLKRSGREVAYAYGAGEAMLLEACGRAWRRAYPRVLALGPLLRSAAARC